MGSEGVSKGMLMLLVQGLHFENPFWETQPLGK